jgi:hypothetical protein
LRFGADLTARQIGELVGLRTNAVEVALHRVLGRLRQLSEVSGDPIARGRDETRTVSGAEMATPTARKQPRV